MPTCERCEREAVRRHRCGICRRMFCSSCLDWPRMRGAVAWCLKTDNACDVNGKVDWVCKAVQAGWREVWTASHGRARRYHVATDDQTAACRPDPRLTVQEGDGIGIFLGQIQDAYDVPKHLRCSRNGCKQRWPV